ncbi:MULTISPECIES: alpha/beta fold hydrolase [Brucella]|uniref:Alpha/beta hydrolase n=1 Tax=Brucella lupini TaxID=255457 RepID=A0A256GC97_9HYPH|nr:MULTISPECIES: alpha/beta hydrolase [Brucella]RNL46270.1 alpha/beta hydrolase [Ochrobactrum sp. MH181795]KAB2706542.1 alpha/beta hydrolase [Brucella lupini]KAB2725573.1 alpha/beta hydrolase [Brucella anthropi]KAB2742884.1 alpha/beta hydrolase [Brucella anthropi]KAB2798074.1 alpha/beta hydrolase [Brucella anthropi]
MKPAIEQLFPGFEMREVETNDVRFAVMTGGKGLPVLLLHGYPETMAAWHRIAPELARSRTVVVPDLPGYGRSRITSNPVGAGSKRRMAASLVALMQALGHERFVVIGHDRGGRVAYRMALDHPDKVVGLVSVTVVPTPEMWEGASKAFGMGAWHWFMLAQPEPLPEMLLSGNPRFMIDTTLQKMAHGLNKLHPLALADYREAFDSAEVRHWICEDYRAGAGVDEADDLADRAAGRRIHAPVLVFWEQGRRYGGGREPLDIWADWAIDVDGEGLAGGHLLPEMASGPILAGLDPFLRRIDAGALAAEQVRDR